MAAAGVALLSLGPRLGLRLVVPALWPGAQLHYSIFSVQAAAASAFLALMLSIPGLAAPGIVIFAIAARALPWLGANVGREPSGEHTAIGDRQ